jgi:hypothetical protein
MIRMMVLGGVAVASLAAMAAGAPAHADRHWQWRHGPHGWFRHWGPAVVVAAPPVYYAPPPVYYAPPPAYYAPPPVVYAPAPVYVVPPIVSFGVRIR